MQQIIQNGTKPGTRSRKHSVECSQANLAQASRLPLYHLTRVPGTMQLVFSLLPKKQTTVNCSEVPFTIWTYHLAQFMPNHCQLFKLCADGLHESHLVYTVVSTLSFHQNLPLPFPPPNQKGDRFYCYEHSPCLSCTRTEAQSRHSTPVLAFWPKERTQARAKVTSLNYFHYKAHRLLHSKRSGTSATTTLTNTSLQSPAGKSSPYNAVYTYYEQGLQRFACVSAT